MKLKNYIKKNLIYRNSNCYDDEFLISFSAIIPSTNESRSMDCYITKQERLHKSKKQILKKVIKTIKEWLTDNNVKLIPNNTDHLKTPFQKHINDFVIKWASNGTIKEFHKITSLVGFRPNYQIEFHDYVNEEIFHKELIEITSNLYKSKHVNPEQLSELVSIIIRQIKKHFKYYLFQKEVTI